MQNQATTSRKLGHVLCDLLASVDPTTRVWRTMSGDFTAEQLKGFIESRHATGLQWLSDHMRAMCLMFAARAAEQKLAARPSVSNVESARTVVKSPFLQVVNESSAKTRFFYWSPETWGVNREQLLTAFAADSELSTQYIACYLQAFEALIQAGETS